MDDEITSIGVSKGIEEIELSPGETFSGEFDVLNLSQTDSVAFRVKISPYSVDDETYDANFTDYDDYNQIVDWTTLETVEGELKSSERKTIVYNISVPKNAPAGGQYLSFLVEIINPKAEEKNLSLSTKSQVASILYASVSGETVKSAEIHENRISLLFLDRPIYASSLLENLGNVHVDAEYILKVYPLFSNEELYSTEEAPVRNVLLPETTLSSEKTWEETPRLGFFRVSQEIRIPETGETSLVEKTVFVSPTWFLILVLMFLFSMIFWLFFRARERKKVLTLKNISV